ncbi:tRNA (adenosine(37)-N6)-threonylcarbamoyltransferase complex dimerization subunit type 1 TsaB [Rhodoluna sp.]|uniref:tRNA (adenosine(37)-N6)-threonylcarbamoyltransferase complex dimerization subunit type 1 TsaB n=1 Tax=Rhodoluna sp. TaxID=1969481 RepID=UPI0025CB898D|nr:tRNA (adenosine(37)-N6)-threonylcarbamoyltransferase complex dimerization subunit type 1 TsaB [Rhodoluna sp.]
MPITLAIDTSAGTSVAVLRGGELLAELNNDYNMKHAEGIGDAISQVIAAAEIKPSQIKTVVVGRGPAPFTGLRIGIAAAIMFSEGVGARLFGVVSLDAVAREALINREIASQVSEEKPLLVTADARRSEVYWALYSGISKSGAPICVEGPAVIKPVALEELLAGRGLQPIRSEAPVRAAQLAKVLDAQLVDGQATDDVTALYLRAPDAVPSPGKKVSG